MEGKQGRRRGAGVVSLLRTLAGREGAQRWDRSPCGTLRVTRCGKPVSAAAIVQTWRADPHRLGEVAQELAEEAGWPLSSREHLSEPSLARRKRSTYERGGDGGKCRSLSPKDDATIESRQHALCADEDVNALKESSRSRDRHQRVKRARQMNLRDTPRTTLGRESTTAPCSAVPTRTTTGPMRQRRATGRSWLREAALLSGLVCRRVCVPVLGTRLLRLPSRRRTALYPLQCCG